MPTDVWSVCTDRSWQQFRYFPPLRFPIFSSCCLLEDLNKHQAAAALRSSFLQPRLGSAAYFYAPRIMVLINLFRTLFLWSFPLAQGAPAPTWRVGNVRTKKRRCGFTPIRWGAKCPHARGRGRHHPFQQPSAPLVFAPVMPSGGSWEPAAAQLGWLLTTNDLIPSINKAQRSNSSAGSLTASHSQRTADAFPVFPRLERQEQRREEKE